MALVCAGGDSHCGAGTGSLPLPLGCGTLVHALETGKEAGGWNVMLTPSSLLEGAMGMPPPNPCIQLQSRGSSCAPATPTWLSCARSPPGTRSQILLGDVLVLRLTRASASRSVLPVAGSGMSWDL